MGWHDVRPVSAMAVEAGIDDADPRLAGRGLVRMLTSVRPAAFLLGPRLPCRVPGTVAAITFERVPMGIRVRCCDVPNQNRLTPSAGSSGFRDKISQASG